MFFRGTHTDREHSLTALVVLGFAVLKESECGQFLLRFVFRVKGPLFPLFPQLRVMYVISVLLRVPNPGLLGFLTSHWVVDDNIKAFFYQKFLRSLARNRFSIPSLSPF